LQDNSLTLILMVRHTDVHNPNDIIYGRLPRFRLSTVGREQAEQVARFLARRRVDELFASPQLRARQTAQIISRYLDTNRIHISRLIAEVRTGYEGQPNKMLGQISFYQPLARPTDETIPMIFDRMSHFLERVRKRYAGRTIVAVSHADPIMILRAGVLGLPLTTESLRGQYYPSKGSVTIFAYPNGIAKPIILYFTPAERRYTSLQERVEQGTGERPALL
jgi:broad specificity phosphatase PhoE